MITSQQDQPPHRFVPVKDDQRDGIREMRGIARGLGAELLLQQDIERGLRQSGGGEIARPCCLIQVSDKWLVLHDGEPQERIGIAQDDPRTGLGHVAGRSVALSYR